MRDTPATVLVLFAIILGMFIWGNGWQDGLAMTLVVATPTFVIACIIGYYREKGRK